MPDNIIKLLLVDDHGLVRRGFRRILEDEPDLRVVGEAGDGPEAVEAAQRLRPDVVVMDFALPSMNGAMATKQILTALPGTAVLILSMYSEPSYVRSSLDAGAGGYLLKGAMDQDLAKAIREIASGSRVLDADVVPLLSASEGAMRLLSPRELQVLQLIIQGKSSRQIAVVLGLSANTVGAHRARLMKALGIHNTAQLVIYALRKGLVKYL